VAIADRLDTLTGCFAVGIMPTGAADPLALRRAAIGILRTLLDKQWDLSLSEAAARAYAGFSRVRLDLDAAATDEKLAGFWRARLKALLSDRLPSDVVEACLASGFDRPHDLLLRARALAAIDAPTRASAGEVFKRAANIAKDAPDGPPLPPAKLGAEVHPSEQKLFDALGELKRRLEEAQQSRDYSGAIGSIAAFAPTIGKYFDDVFVMDKDDAIRNNRLRLMREIQKTCSSLANFNLLAPSA
jgi:glycyl-tRNA synthetase beta chain